MKSVAHWTVTTKSVDEAEPDPQQSHGCSSGYLAPLGAGKAMTSEYEAEHIFLRCAQMVRENTKTNTISLSYLWQVYFYLHLTPTVYFLMTTYRIS